MIEQGEIITLENTKEFIVVNTKEISGVHYLFLVSNFKPLEVKFAKQLTVGDEPKLELINNAKEKKELVSIFDLKINI